MFTHFRKEKLLFSYKRENCAKKLCFLEYLFQVHWEGATIRKVVVNRLPKPAITWITGRNWTYILIVGVARSKFWGGPKIYYSDLSSLNFGWRVFWKSAFRCLSRFVWKYLLNLSGFKKCENMAAMVLPSRVYEPNICEPTTKFH